MLKYSSMIFFQFFQIAFMPGTVLVPGCFYESDSAMWRVVWGQNIDQRTTEKAELFSNERCRRHKGKRRDASRMWD